MVDLVTWEWIWDAISSPDNNTMNAHIWLLVIDRAKELPFVRGRSERIDLDNIIYSIYIEMNAQIWVEEFCMDLFPSHLYCVSLFRITQSKISFYCSSHIDEMSLAITCTWANRARVYVKICIINYRGWCHQPQLWTTIEQRLYASHSPWNHYTKVQ